MRKDLCSCADCGDGYLSEESLAAPSSRCRVVDVDIVVLGTHRFLYEGFREHLPVHLDVVFPFHQVTLCTGEDFSFKLFSTKERTKNDTSMNK